MNGTPCPLCACTRAEGVSAHAILAALVTDDLDRAIELGLLASDGCAGCSDLCSRTMTAARDARLRALAARERFRVREARLQRRSDERANKRATNPRPVEGRDTASDGGTAKPALPSAAAAALERAKAKAAERGSR